MKIKITFWLIFAVSASAVAQIPTLEWSRQIGSTGADKIIDATRDASGNFYLTGWFSGTIDFDPSASTFNMTSAGQRDIFVLKLTPNGDFVWAFRTGSTSSEGGYEIAVDATGNVYVSGTFSTSFDFDPGAGTTNLTTAFEDIYFLKLDPNGNFLWAKDVGAAESDLIGDIGISPAGELVAVGLFRSTVDFDPSAGVANLTAAALYDIFILRLDLDGNFLNVGHVTGNGSEAANALAFDPSGNMFITGNFQVTVDFDPGAGTFTMAPGGGSDNTYILKLTPTGAFTWAIQMGSPSDESGTGITTDSDGNVYISGNFQGTADFDPSGSVANIVSAGDRDVFVAKYNPSGQLLMVKSFGGTLGDYGHNIALDASNNIWVAGQFFGTTDLDPGAGVFNLTSAGGADMYYLKLDVNGNLLYGARAGSTGTDLGHITSRNGGSDELFLYSEFQNTVDFDPTSSVINVTSVGGSDGIFLKVKEIASPGPAISGFTPTSGMVGATVTINGSGFSSIASNNTVQFNGTAATVVVSSLTYITVTVPSGATTGPISVTVGGVTATSSTDFTVIPTPVISIDTQPGSFGLCPDGAGSLTVEASGTSNLTYRWQKFDPLLSTFQDLNNGTGYSGVTTTTLNIDFDAGATPGDYRVRVNGDFAAQQLSSTASVTYLPTPPAPTVTATPNDGSCGPTTITITANAVGAVEYRWYESDNLNFAFYSEASGSFTTPRLSGSTPYAVKAFDGTCEGPHTPFVATVNYNGPGSQDLSFATAPNSDQNISFIDDMVIQPDNKIIVNHFEVGAIEYMLYRVNADGSTDASFDHILESRFNARVDHLGLQSDGKIILAGRFTTIDGDTYGRIARANADGTLDVTFNAAGSGFNARINELEVLPDDKILVSGNFTTYNSAPAPYFVRLNSDGSRDATFNMGTGPNSAVRAFHVQSDGKIIISGLFTTFNGVATPQIIRLNSDGSIDATFVGPSGAIYPIIIATQPDGKILLGGGFTTVSGVPRNNIARLNADGSLDTTFDPGTGFDDDVYALYVEPSGKIFAGGWFGEFNGEPQNFITRLNPDGTRDPFFEVGIGPYTLVTDIFPFGTNRVLVGGYISHWNSNLVNGMALVDNTCVRTPTAIGGSGCDGNITLSACGGQDGQYRWYTQSSGGSPIAGETSSSLSLTNVTSTTTYYVALGDAVCESARVPVVATVTSGLTAPAVTASTACSGEPQTVSASGASDGDYRWYASASGGSPISGETNSAYTTPVLTSTTTYYVSVVNGSCESPRSPVTATVTPLPSLPTVTGNSVCGNGTVTLSASGASAGQYRWYTTPSGGTAISGETNSSYTTPSLSTTTSYFVSIHNGSCEGNRAEVVATVNAIPSAPSATGVSVCAGTSANLSASGATAGNYRWYDEAQNLIAGQTQSQLTTSVLTSNATFFVSQFLNGCESPLVQILVTVTACTVNNPPVIQSTGTVAQIGGSVELDLSGFISDVDGNLDWSTLSIVVPPASGALASITSSGLLSLDYSGRNFSGNDQLTIRICDDVGSCSDAVINVEVIGDVIIYNAISPNGDGVNDILRIEYIDIINDTRENEVSIFNRWGDEVFSVRNYDNNQNAFRGLNKNGNELPSGTYFYTIRFLSGRESKNGYLSLKR